MDELNLAMHGINVFFGALLVGALVMESFMVVPLFRSSPPAEVLRMHHRLNDLGLPQHLSFGIIAGVSGIIAFFLDLDVARDAAPFTFAGVAFAIAGVLVLVLRYLPVGRVMLAWDAPPPDYEDVFRRWARWQYARTACYVPALIAFIVGAIVA